MNWKEHLKYDNEGRAYFLLEGAALFLGISPKTLSNRCYKKLGPKREKKNGQIRFYFDELKAYDKASVEVINDTNWLRFRKSA